MSLAGYDTYQFGGRELWVNGAVTDIIDNIKAFWGKVLCKLRNILLPIEVRRDSHIYASISILYSDFSSMVKQSG